MHNLQHCLHLSSTLNKITGSTHFQACDVSKNPQDGLLQSCTEFTALYLFCWRKLLYFRESTASFFNLFFFFFKDNTVHSTEGKTHFLCFQQCSLLSSLSVM